MCWGGTDGPAGNAIFVAIGLMGEEENKRHAAALFKHVNKHLGIPEDRLYIIFEDVKAFNVGFKGTTIKALRLFD
uniref:L-dopachrome isomerase n=1 Tax=Timema poppense TaxID=170557 RepID=A0A7R9HGX7_TIMPO|nr:unnamed protein product [Timema poppensis]